MQLTPTEKLILRDLQQRKSLSLKGSHEGSSLSYRQFLRRVDDLVENKIISGWTPIIHPLVRQAKKKILFFLKTNPRDPQDLNYFQNLGGQLLALDGIAGVFSLVALMQFQNDSEFNQSIAKIEEVFKVEDPTKEPQRFQHLEIIAFYKYNGIPINENVNIINPNDLQLIETIIEIGTETQRPPNTEEIAKSFKNSASNIQRRLKVLEESNAILGYGIRINQKYRPPIKMIVQIKIRLRSINEIISFLQDDPHVPMLLKTQSEMFSLLAITYANSIQDFNIWLKELYAFEDVLDTLTTVVLDDETKGISSLLFPIL